MTAVDYTKLPREKVYRDRDEISDFGTEIRNSINWLHIRYIFDSEIIELEDTETNILKIFNDAYYITTVMLAQQNPIMKFGWYIKTACEVGTIDDVYGDLFIAATMGMVVNYLKICDEKYCAEGEMLTSRIYQWIDDKYGFRGDESTLFKSIYNIPDEVILSARKEMSRNDFAPLSSGVEESVATSEDNCCENNSALIKDLEDRLKAAEESYKKLEEEADRVYRLYQSAESDVAMWHSMYDEAVETKKKFEAENHLLREMLSQQKKEIVEKEPDMAFNTATGSPCFTSRQMGIFLTAVALLTENPAPGKTTLGEVVEKISGYKATTVIQNLKGSFRDADKETVAKALESKFPKLAAKIRQI